LADHGEHVVAERFDPCDGTSQELVDTAAAGQGDHAMCVLRRHALILGPPGSCSNPPAA
jgi:hypothetical protein